MGVPQTEPSAQYPEVAGAGAGAGGFVEYGKVCSWAWSWRAPLMHAGVWTASPLNFLRQKSLISLSDITV